MSRPLVQPPMWGRRPGLSRSAPALLVLALVAAVLACVASGAAAAPHPPPRPPRPRRSSRRPPRWRRRRAPARSRRRPRRSRCRRPPIRRAPAGGSTRENCSGCHGARGEGLVGPPLAAAGLRQPGRADGRRGRHQHAGVRRRAERRGRGRRLRLRRRRARRPGGPDRAGRAGRRPLPPLLLRLPQRHRQRRRDADPQQRAQHPPVPAGRGDRGDDPRARQHAVVRRQHLRRAPAGVRRAVRAGDRRPAVAGRVPGWGTSGRSPRAPPAPSRSCCSSSSPSGSPGGRERPCRERREQAVERRARRAPHVTTWPVGLGIVATIVGAVSFVVCFVVGREQRLDRRLARPGPARPRPRARVLGPRPGRRRGHRRPVPRAARRHRGSGRARHAARRARLRAHAPRLPLQVRWSSASACSPSARWCCSARSARGRATASSPRAGARAAGWSTSEGEPVTRDVLATGGFLVAFPEGGDQKADSQIVLLHFVNGEFTPQPGRETWSPEDFVAYSRVCTHAGCPVAAVRRRGPGAALPVPPVDVRRAATAPRPPAARPSRPLPQLPLAIDDEGVLYAQSDFTEPVGPGFWNA